MATKCDLRLLEAPASQPEIAGLVRDRRSFLRAASLPCLAACAAAVMGGGSAVPLFAAAGAEDVVMPLGLVGIVDAEAFVDVEARA